MNNLWNNAANNVVIFWSKSALDFMKEYVKSWSSFTFILSDQEGIKKEEIKKEEIKNFLEKEGASKILPTTPMTPTQAFLLLSAWLFYQNQPENLWEDEFYQYLVLVESDLKETEEVETLIQTLATAEITGEESKAQWRQEAERKYTEKLLGKTPPFYLNGTGAAIGQMVFHEQIDPDYFDTASQKVLTPEVISLIKDIGNKHKGLEKLDIRQAFIKRFPSSCPSDPENDGAEFLR